MVSVICVESMHALTSTAVSISGLFANVLWREVSGICLEGMHTLTETVVSKCLLSVNFLIVWKACRH